MLNHFTASVSFGDNGWEAFVTIPGEGEWHGFGETPEDAVSAALADALANTGLHV